MFTKVYGRRMLVAALCVALTSTVLAISPAAAQQEPGAQAPPPRAMERSQRGEAAIQALGDRLPEVARAHGMNPGRLLQLFRADETLWVDPTLRLYYVEPTIDQHGHDQEPSSTDGGAALGAAAPHPLEETFLLESRPGSPRTIYLDFDGATVTGTAWNDPPPGGFGGGETIAADAYDTDGDPMTFSDSEKEDVQDIWRRVAEDFAPFDVNITTADPGYAAINKSNIADAQHGTRVVIDGGTPALSCGCGGIAYLGVFDAIGTTHDYYQPAWVFQGGVGSPKNIAEAASHEVGHNLGLQHDGLDYGTVPDPANPGEEMPHPDNRDYYTGHGVWAPIMGVGYSKPVVQWSKGEYAAPSNTEDDYVVMLANGLGTITDDHPAAFDGTATNIGVAPAPLAGSGIISTVDDADVFSFTAHGGLTIVQANPAAVSPNLDISLSLHDSTGALISNDDSLSAFASTDVATGLDAELAALLDAGSTYYVRIDGVGALTPSDGYSDYGSLGSYDIDVLSGACSLGDPGEDDDDAATARLLLGGSSFSGTRCPGDDDWYVIPGISGATLSATLEATDLGGDVDMELLDAALVQQQVAQTAGTTESLIHPFTSDGDHYLRVYSATDSETRYDLTTSMPVCPPAGPYEAGNGDDYPHQGFVQPLALPGVKDAVSCADDMNGDFVEVALEAGREFEATIRFPAGNESSIGFWMMDYEVSGWPALSTANSSGIGFKTLRFTPEVTGTYEVRVNPDSGAVPYRLTASQPATVVAEPPAISDINPTTGSPGDSVTITGSGFDTATDVNFSDGVAAVFSVYSDAELVATVPSGAVDGPVTVVNSGGSTTSSQTFDVTEPPPNSAPTAVDDAAVVTEARSTDIDVLFNDTDPDNDFLTITAATAPTNGGAVDCTVEVFNLCRFTPASGTTTDVFTYTVSDGNGGEDSATVTVTIEECADLASGLDPTNLVTSESWTACSDPAASAVTATAPTHMPATGGTVALMTSGDATIADPPNDETGAGVGHGSTRSGAYDVSIKRLDVAVPSGANCISFELVFGSEEYEEYVGQTFNDAFIAELDSTDWSVDLMTGDITAPNNIALDPSGNVVSVNSVFFGNVITDNGTQYDGATPVLLVRTPVTEGAHSLYLSIFDAGDDIYDSGAFIDNLQATTEAEGACTAGAVEADDPPTVSLTSPAAGSTVRGPVDLTATAADDVGVEQVEFFVDGVSVGFGTAGAGGTWSLTWNSAGVGDGQSHVVSAVATDTGAQSTTATSTVTILSNAVADFNGDGDTDVAIYRPSNGRWYAQGLPYVAYGIEGDEPVPGDYDGDGRTDVAVYRSSTGRWYVAGAAPVGYGINGDVPVPADYDGDGDTDIAVFRPSNGRWYIMNQGYVAYGLPEDIPVPGDYDGDGAADIAIYRPSSGRWYVHGQPVVAVGVSGDIPVPGDYDGDGDIDFAVYRPSTGRWYVAGAAGVGFGISGDVPVPGDYDGDGDTDVAVYRPGNGRWYVKDRSYVAYGIAGDIPLPTPYAIRRST